MIWNWVHPFFTDFTREHWAKFIPPIADSFMTNIDTALVKQIFDITKREWKSVSLVRAYGTREQGKNGKY